MGHVSFWSILMIFIYLGKNIYTIKNTEELLYSSKEFILELKKKLSVH